MTLIVSVVKKRLSGGVQMSTQSNKQVVIYATTATDGPQRLVCLSDGDRVASVLVNANGSVDAVDVASVTPTGDRMLFQCLVQPRDPLETHRQLASVGQDLCQLTMQKDTVVADTQ